MNSTYKHLVSLALSLFFFTFSAQSAEIKISCADIKSGICWENLIEISGEIKPGDLEKLKEVIADGQKKSVALRPKTILINSRGGDLAEALKMAELIKPLYYETRVAYDGYCASSCLFVWLSGAPRRGYSADTIKMVKKTSHPKLWPKSINGMIGLHRPYFRNPQEPDPRQQSIMVSIRKILEDSNFPRYLIDIMMSRPSNDVYWLLADDFIEVGEYSPDIEELLINKCGYFRARPENIASRGIEEQLRIVGCAQNIIDNLQKKAHSRI